ncbi:MAG: NirD/YgiW/YdeI family stress tolerance protein, partial [Xanthomonadaceae bacterium]|nr:NirD/YgiW/YdeI family stress tolerance protein [Xanthomonadaceae bacterium]
MCFSANAQYEGPGEAEIRTKVSDVMMKPRVGQYVVIEGRLTKRLDTGVFMFTDGTAEIRIRVDPRTLVDNPVTETSMVEIRGRIAEDFRSTPEIE